MSRILDNTFIECFFPGKPSPFRASARNSDLRHFFHPSAHSNSAFGSNDMCVDHSYYSNKNTFIKAGETHA
jgi:hypothetical protein